VFLFGTSQGAFFWCSAHVDPRLALDGFTRNGGSGCWSGWNTPMVTRVSTVVRSAVKFVRRRTKLFSFLAAFLILSASATIGHQFGHGAHWFVDDALATTSSTPQEDPTGFAGLANGMVDDTTHAADQA